MQREAVVLSLLLIATTTALDIPQEDVLLLTQVVIRHADRAPQWADSSPEAEAVFFRGLGHLSDTGLENAYAQGLHFKQRYVDTGFVDARMIPSQVAFESSPVPRCMMSAYSFGAALFNKTVKDFARVPPVSISPMLHPRCFCEEDWAPIEEKHGLPFGSMHEGVYTASLKDSIACKDYSVGMIEALVAEAENPKITLNPSQKACAEEGKRHNYRFLQTIAGAGEEHSEVRLRRNVGQLTKKLLDRMAKVISCGSTCDLPRMRVYYSHDVLLLALADVFGVLDGYNKITPNFSSAIVLELHSSRFGPYVKILLKDGEKSQFKVIGGCDSSRNCTLDAVIHAAEKYAIEDPGPCTYANSTFQLGLHGLFVSMLLMMLGWQL